MKILFVNGSPRRGNTALVLEALAARLGAHEVETANLSDLRVNGCIGCLKCQQDVDHFVCHQAGDDANAVLAKIVAADVVLFATPLYGHSFTAQLKCLADRASALVKWVGGREAARDLGIEGEARGPRRHLRRALRRQCGPFAHAL